jgi:hypothetical protein
MQIGCVHTQIYESADAELPSYIREAERQKAAQGSWSLFHYGRRHFAPLRTLLTEMSVVLFTLFTVCVPLIKRKSRFFPRTQHALDTSKREEPLFAIICLQCLTAIHERDIKNTLCRNKPSVCTHNDKLGLRSTRPRI